jgi:hypothetical protein
LPIIALVGDEKAGLIRHQPGDGVALLQQFAYRAINPLDVGFKKLGQRGHVMRTAARFG